MPHRPAAPDYCAPRAWRLALELRAPWELGAVIPSWATLCRAPAGDGHPVIVFPGLSANDASTIPLRAYLDRLGYKASGWNQGFNWGPRDDVLERARQQLQDTSAASGQKLSLVGWSLGGIYARELAKQMPDQVRSVITLGTPFAGSPRSTNAWRIYQLARGRLPFTSRANTICRPHRPRLPRRSIRAATASWPGRRVCRHPTQAGRLPKT